MNRAEKVTKIGIPHHSWYWPNPKEQIFNNPKPPSLFLNQIISIKTPLKQNISNHFYYPFNMAGINPIPPISPIPSNSPIFPSTILADELYKCANPPPSYQSAIEATNASQSRNHCGAIIMAAPFGGSLSQVFPCNSTQLTMEPPPAYSRSPPRRNSMEGENTRRKYISLKNF